MVKIQRAFILDNLKLKKQVSAISVKYNINCNQIKCISTPMNDPNRSGYTKLPVSLVYCGKRVIANEHLRNQLTNMYSDTDLIAFDIPYQSCLRKMSRRKPKVKKKKLQKTFLRHNTRYESTGINSIFDLVQHPKRVF